MILSWISGFGSARNRGAVRRARVRGSRGDTGLATERLEPRVAAASLAPTVLEQVLLERINDQRVAGNRTPLAFEGRMQRIALTAAEGASIPALKSALTKAKVPWDPKDSITSGGFGTAAEPVGTSPAEITWAAEMLAEGHPLTGSLGGSQYNRHRMVGIVVLGPDDPRNGFGDMGLLMTADVTASIKGRNPIVTGVAFRDANTNGLYDAGEGLPDLRIAVNGKSVRASVDVWETGGFSLPLKVAKRTTVTVTASGPSLEAPLTQTVVVRPGSNTRVNFVVPAGTEPA